MPSTKQSKRRRPSRLRGSTLDAKIEETLAEMMALGYQNAPISRVAVQKRLGLNSRGTLVGKRGHIIDAARVEQMRQAGFDPDGRNRRRSLEERCKALEESARRAQKERDYLVEQLCIVIRELTAKGIDVESVLHPFRPNCRKSGRS